MTGLAWHVLPPILYARIYSSPTPQSVLPFFRSSPQIVSRHAVTESRVGTTEFQRKSESVS